MSKILKVIVFGLMLFCLTACNNPMNRKYNETTLSKDLKDIGNAHKVDSLEGRLMIMYILRAKCTGEKLEGNTYGDIVEKAKKAREANSGKK
jgi:hypothetical protein